MGLTFSQKLMAAPMDNVGSDPKFWGAVLAALILFLSSQIVLIGTINSQRKMLAKTIDENRKLEEEKANRQYRHALTNEKREKLLEIVNSVIEAQSWGSERSRYLFVTSEKSKDLRESFREVLARIQTAKSISTMYFPDIQQQLSDIEIPLRDFLISVENQIDCVDKAAKQEWKETAQEQAKLLEKKAEMILCQTGIYAVELRVEIPK